MSEKETDAKTAETESSEKQTNWRIQWYITIQ